MSGADDEEGAAGADAARIAELGAHVDRAWDLVTRGDLDGAERAAREVLAIDADAPEAHTLLGSIAAGRGDEDAALEHYERASEIDPEFVDPLLYAAELRLFAHDDAEEAIRLCEQALDVAEEEDEYLDALLLKAEAHLADGDDDSARAALAELPPTDYPEPDLHLRAGRLFLDLGDADAAEREVRRALARSPDDVDALHTLGLLHEERGDARAMVKTFLDVRKADLAAPAPPWGLPKERFEELAEAAMAELPERIRKLLENVPVLVADYPAVELVAEGSDPRMMGFFSGVPYPDKSTLAGQPPHLDCVFLYQRNIERVSRSAVEIEHEIVSTLLHETGHFFGLSEEELEEMGLG